MGSVDVACLIGFKIMPFFCSTVVLVLLEDGDGSICRDLHSRFVFHCSVESAAIRRRTIFVCVLSGVLIAAEVLCGASDGHCRLLTNCSNTREQQLNTFIKTFI